MSLTKDLCYACFALRSLQIRVWVLEDCPFTVVVGAEAALVEFL